MARRLPLLAVMRSLLLLLTLFSLSWTPASAQGADPPDGVPIASIEVSGLSLDRLSPGLRQELDALAGAALNRERLAALAARIEAERPDVVAAVRSVSEPGGEARVVFLVARISDDRNLVSNINTRYVVEQVDVEGVAQDAISQQLRDDLQALVGARLDDDEAERLDRRLEAELPGYQVSRRIVRGAERGRIRLVFEAREADATRWIRFTPSRSKAIYQTDQGWSGVLDIPLGGPRNHRFTLGLVFGNDDDLVEEYSGYRVRVESRRVATRRVGASLELSSLRSSWAPATLTALAADPRLPEPYRARLTVEPSVGVAFTANLRVRAGVSISELESLSRSPDSQMASAAVLSIAYDRRSEPRPGTTQSFETSYLVRRATTALGSDLVYTRHLAQAGYRYQQGRSTVLAGLAVGRVTGDAPLFERWSLGNSSTLRGWHKLDIAPAGGTRLFHQSIEYRYHGVAFFVDAGSVSEPDAARRTQVATGFGFHGDNAFLTLGFPLNAGDVTARLIMGVRF